MGGFGIDLYIMSSWVEFVHGIEAKLLEYSQTPREMLVFLRLQIPRLRHKVTVLVQLSFRVQAY